MRGKRKTRQLIQSAAFLCLVLFGCKPEVFVFTDNAIPHYDEISTILVQNYVNRFYIDLIGREPNDLEMERDVLILEEGDLAASVRLQVIQVLMTSTDSTDESTYTTQYHRKLYTDLKARFLEGASDAILNARYGLLRSMAIQDSLNGNFAGYTINNSSAERLLLVMDSDEALESGEIDVREACGRMLWNTIYDQINMNSFNFIQASFDDLYQRFPTQAEFDVAYGVIENNQPGILFGTSAHDKPSYVDALIWNTEWDEGMVRWQYRTMLARDPSDSEILESLNVFTLSVAVADIQRVVLISDEYAGF